MRFILLSLLALCLVPVSPASAWNPREPSTACNGKFLEADVGGLTPARKKQIIAQEEAKLAELRKEASRGDQAATMALCTQRYIAFTTPDYTDIGSWCRKAADKGNPEALNQLGIYYRDGLGVQQDYAEAVKLWLQAAAHPEPFSLTPSCELAWMYAQGKGVKQDWSEAYYWGTLYSLASGYQERTHPLDTASHLTPEQIQLVNKRVAERAAQDPVLREALRKEEIRAGQAAELLAKAEQGDASAQTKIGWLYHEGAGLTKDDAEAMKWFRKAADQGNSSAEGSIGAMYAHGWGVPRDDAESMKWTRRAAEHGYVNAMRSLGTIYYYSRGPNGHPDYQEAYFWLSLTARSKPNFPFPSGMLDMAARHLTPEQKASVDKRLAAWKPTPATTGH